MTTEQTLAEEISEGLKEAIKFAKGEDVEGLGFKEWKQPFDNITIIPNNDFLQERDDTEPQNRECFKSN